LESFAEVREYIQSKFELFHDEPFIIGFEYELDGGRRQNMFLAELKNVDGRRYLRVETTVVPLTQIEAEKCLRINQVQRIGYLAVGDLDGEAYIKMCENIPYRTLNLEELTYHLGHIAQRADRFEEVVGEGEDFS